MILTMDFINATKPCEEGREWAINNDLVGKEYNEAIRTSISLGRSDIAAWFIEQKKSEVYVRLNGSECTMIYDVYSPFDGTHTRAATEEEAKAISAKVAEDVIKKVLRPVVSKVLVNDVGDETFMGEDPAVVDSLTVK
jgi:hypothetical protein